MAELTKTIKPKSITHLDNKKPALLGRVYGLIAYFIENKLQPGFRFLAR